MFPSSGNFKSIHCPYYLEDKCKRIYCHFRHVKNSSEKSGENALLSSLEDQICSGLRIDKAAFDRLMREDNDRSHEKILNEKLKSLFPDQQKLLDEFRFPDTLKDIFDFTTNTFSEENVNDSINLTEQDDEKPLDEGPLKQFLEEDAKRSFTEQKNQNTLEKRHMVISCLEKIDKKEFIPRRVGVVPPRKFEQVEGDFDSSNDIQSVNTNEALTQPVDNGNTVRIKQEDDESDSSDPEDYAEVENILTQMELMNPQLFNSGEICKNEEIKPEPVDTFGRNGGFNSISLENASRIPKTESVLSSIKPLNNVDNARPLPRINPKSVQAINNEISDLFTPSSPPPAPSFRVKSEQTHQNKFVVPIFGFLRYADPPSEPMIAAATIAEQNRLKNVFKNTICANIDQFFDLCDACRVYGTEIFSLLEPLLNYLIEKLNPEFNFEKLRQLRTQNMSLQCALPFVSSCDHVANCIECHNLVSSSLAKLKAKKEDKWTETMTPLLQIAPLRKIEADLHEITKDIISLTNEDEMVGDAKDEKSTARSNRSSHKHHDGDRRHAHDSAKSREKSSKGGSVERRSSSSSHKRSSHSHSGHSRDSKSSSSSRHGHEKRKKESQNEEEGEDKAKRRRSSSGREQSGKRHASGDNHGSDTKKSKSESLSKTKPSHSRESKRCKSVEEAGSWPEANDVNLDSENEMGIFGSPPSDSSSDVETIVDIGSVDEDDSRYEEEREEAAIADLQHTVSVKKRISHVNETNSSSIYRKSIARKNIPTPAEVLFQRMEQSKKLQENTNESISNLFNSGSDKVRISHVPNVALMLRAKERLKSNLLAKPTIPVAATSPLKTVAQSVSKGSSRIAHVPTEATKTNPDLPSGTSNSRPVIASYKATNNIPLPTRQNGLDRLFNAFAKKVPSELASELALKEEQTIHEKVTIVKIYLNSLAMAVHRILKEDPARLMVKNSEYPTELNGLSTYELLSKHVLTYEQLEINGFPLSISSMRGCCMISTKAVHYKPLTSKRNGDRFYCQQCKDLFDIDPETGIPISSKGCKFHQFRPRKEAGRTRHDMYYPCCNKSITESGCMSADYHTPDTTDDDCLRGFVETRDAPPGDSNSRTFYSLDCEMCYTTVGQELTRVTVIGPECTVVYDSLVKPRNKILDYCTKFSGITKEKLRNVSKTLEEVREELFRFIFKDTILIGHSLENDLKALKILHHKVVDTSVMFPHRDAPERKFALKQLSSTIAQYLIQDNDSGHDSEEDARACMKLVWKKLREDAQVYKPRKIISSPIKQR